MHFEYYSQLLCHLRSRRLMFVKQHMCLIAHQLCSNTLLCTGSNQTFTDCVLQCVRYNKIHIVSLAVTCFTEASHIIRNHRNH